MSTVLKENIMYLTLERNGQHLRNGCARPERWYQHIILKINLITMTTIQKDETCDWCCSYGRRSSSSIKNIFEMELRRGGKTLRMMRRGRYMI